MLFLPDDLLNSEKSKSLVFYNYISYVDSKPVKIVLNHNLISFLVSGEKKLDYYNKNSIVTDKDLAILFSGNCIMKDKTSPYSKQYNNILLFFSNEYISHVYSKYYRLITNKKIKRQKKKDSFIIIKKDHFINNYIHSLQNLFTVNPENKISEELSLIKFEELMLYFIQNKPNIFQLFLNNPSEKTEYKFKAIIEEHITKNTKLSDLAYLLNMSLSTFSRKFKNIYGCSAAQYILNRRMEIAEELLTVKGLSPSEVYHLVGYENFSSFSHAFKKRLGQSPKKYQQLTMTD